MDISWLTAFLDLPAGRFDDGAAFWCQVTDSGLSSYRGDQDQFATLLPPDGGDYLKVQRLDLDAPRVHLDIHLDRSPGSIAGGAAEAAALGAEVEALGDHAVLRSPAGLIFCLVDHQAGTARPQPVPDPAPHRVDQVCLDVPAEAFDSEVRFWSELTGWAIRPSALDEFVALDQPTDLPLRILLQRLGPDDPGPTARAHLDVACGSEREAVARHHVGLGASAGSPGVLWHTMVDPAGMTYCVTGRDPFTGLPPRASSEG